MDKCILTIATGKQLYMDMAATLARSYRATNRDTQIPFVIATDRPDRIASDVSDWVTTVRVNPLRHGEGFETKLWMDELSPARKTLFVDADCLIVQNVSPVFELFHGKAVSVLGECVSEGEWFGSIKDRCTRLNVAAVPRFVGAVYYFDKTLGAAETFQAARELAASYDTLGMVRLRNRKNEEPLISMAMALFGHLPVCDDGSIKADAMHFPDLHSVDVLRGHARFRNTSGFRCTTSPRVAEALPRVAHFNDAYVNGKTYRREAFILRSTQQARCPPALARMAAWFWISLPSDIRASARNRLRPIYHALFGVRRVSGNPRL
jgi:hypothetical protein